MQKSCCKLVLLPSCDLYLISIQLIMRFCLVVMVTHRFCNMQDLDYFYGFWKEFPYVQKSLCSWLHIYIFRGKKRDLLPSGLVQNGPLSWDGLPWFYCEVLQQVTCRKLKDTLVTALYMCSGTHLHLKLESSSVLHKNVEKTNSPN